MTHLKREPIKFKLNPNVTLLQHITKENSSLKHIEAQVFHMKEKGNIHIELKSKEVCIVALSGKYNISDGDQEFENVGTRKTVFEKIPTDSVYIPCDKEATITCVEEGNIILCYSPSTDKKRETTLISAKNNSIEKRGQYNNNRLVHNILDDKSKVSENLLVVEVYTNSGNWSSYPPHKHDQNNLPEESFLEETYYHELDPQQGFIFQRIYTDDKLLDETMAVYNQDMVIVPKGYHPVSVPDGYDSYYLNIMAGPVKTWKFHNEKDHEWILNRPKEGDNK